MNNLKVLLQCVALATKEVILLLLTDDLPSQTSIILKSNLNNKPLYTFQAATQPMHLKKKWEFQNDGHTVLFLMVVS